MILGHIWHALGSHDVFTLEGTRVVCLHLSNPMHRSRFLMGIAALARSSLRSAVH
jgi:hypothetical protein